MRLGALGLRGRLVVAVSLLSLATLGAAFATVSLVVNRSQQRQLDEALVPAAQQEAADLASSDPPGGSPPVISARPGPAANDVGPLPKYVAVYWPDGRLASATLNFAGRAPTIGRLRHPNGVCFDFWIGAERVRAVLVRIPQHPGARLLMAVSRGDLDGDASFLARAMISVFMMAVAWTAVIAWWIAGRLTRAHRAIVKTTKLVAKGDLAARVGGAGETTDPEGLARNIDAMIERLALLLRGQHQFIAQAAHELRSPLTMLYGELSLALRRERQAAEYKQTIEEALIATRRLTHLAEDLLSLAKLGTEAKERVEQLAICEVITRAIAAISEEANRRNVTIELCAEEWTIPGRAGDIERLLRNLLENAVRHAPVGTSVRIETRPGRDALTIEVLDRGAGVSSDEVTQIFQPFFRGRHVRAGEHFGAGLGLTIARDIARLHGGDVTLAPPDAGPGARFLVTLPRVAASA